MYDDATEPQLPNPGGYISFVARFWVGENGEIVRGTIEDVHSGTHLALDLSELVAFLQKSLAHSPGRALNELDDSQGSSKE